MSTLFKTTQFFLKYYGWWILEKKNPFHPNPSYHFAAIALGLSFYCVT
jgi:hypothetical protein